jgi:ParB family chromosome partitioning protein
MSQEQNKSSQQSAHDKRRSAMPTERQEIIPLNKLVAWEGNVRKVKGADAALAELAASIQAHGLLQSLVVRKGKKDTFAVVAGGRRLEALQHLAKTKIIAADYPVPCSVLSNEADATEVSLAENAIREDMHPADQFDAFFALSKSGMPNADIAARFGVTDTIVQKRLKLANVSPVILQAYRDDETDLETLMAFAITDDHARQEKVWKSLPKGSRDGRGHQVRRMLTEDEVNGNDRRVRFVTVAAYEKAGGTTRRDLFADDDEGIFIDNVELLDRLVQEKLERAAAKVRKEGWKWVEVREEYDYSEWSRCERRHQEYEPLPPDQQAELDALQTEYKKLDDDHDDAVDAFYEDESRDEDAEEPEIPARLEELAKQIQKLQKGRKRMWLPDTLAIAGAVVSIGYNGQTDTERGLVKPENKPKKLKSVTKQNGDGTIETVEVEQAFTLSAPLIESLTAHRSAALTAELIDNGFTGLAVLAHVLAAQVFYNTTSGDSCVQIAVTDEYFRQVEGSPAKARIDERIDERQAAWRERLPAKPDDLFAWCLSQKQTVLIELLTYCTAVCVDTVIVKGTGSDERRLKHADQVAGAVRLDMGKWFTPTVENYFGKISKSGILEALTEAGKEIAPAWQKAKKGELADIAAREIIGTGWLPEPLRVTTEVDAAFKDAA